MSTLVYKRTHNGDPDKDSGEFGCNGCMGRVRALPFDSVIGVGGQGTQAKKNDIAFKVTWIGIGRHDRYPRGWDDPIVTFDHFFYDGPRGDLLELCAPNLAKRMYRKNPPRFILDDFDALELADIQKLLAMAQDAPPSPALAQKLVSKKSVVRPPGKC